MPNLRSPVTLLFTYIYVCNLSPNIFESITRQGPLLQPFASPVPMYLSTHSWLGLKCWVGPRAAPSGPKALLFMSAWTLPLHATCLGESSHVYRGNRVHIVQHQSPCAAAHCFTTAASSLHIALIKCFQVQLAQPGEQGRLQPRRRGKQTEYKNRLYHGHQMD